MLRNHHRLASLALITTALGTGCFTTSYLAQAGLGEAEMLASARPLLTSMRDPRTPPHVRRLLFQLARIKAFGQSQGLRPTRNYERYADLHREAAVWVVEACPPLSFESRRWTFPIVGSVPYLGFFDRTRAEDYARQLESTEAMDVEVRGASAFSTLGWFRDPVLSTMIAEGADAEGDLANTVLHESVHATVYVPDQSAFDESLASYVADHLTLIWMKQQHGASSTEAKEWVEGEARSKERVARLHAVHDQLQVLYASSLPDDEKLRRKQSLITGLQTELKLRHPLNNASLAGYATYDTGGPAFDALLGACDQRWDRFLDVIATLRASDFRQPQAEDFSAVIQRLVAAGCPRAPHPATAD